MKALLVVGLASLALAGCAIVPVGPRYGYYDHYGREPRPVIVAPVIVGHPHDGWWRDR